MNNHSNYSTSSSSCHSTTTAEATNQSGVRKMDWKIPEELCVHQTETYGKDRCNKCPLGGGCFQPRAAHQPVPLWIWILFGSIMAFPLYWVTQPRKAKTMFYTAVSDDEVAAAWRRAWYDKIFRQIGIEHPENVFVFETDALEKCSAVGTNMKEGGALVFIPRILAALTNPDTVLRIPDNDGNVIFDGTVADLTPEIRANILEKTGVLLPDHEEISYVIGHEASHIYYNHAIKSSVFGGLSAAAAHFVLKLYNRWVWASRSKPGFPFKPLASKWSHLSILLFTTIFAGIAIAKYQERQADVHSAKKLHLKQSAINLTYKKQRQNQIVHSKGDYMKTSSGNNLADWEHPSITKQIEYLQEIQEDHIEQEK